MWSSTACCNMDKCVCCARKGIYLMGGCAWMKHPRKYVRFALTTNISTRMENVWRSKMAAPSILKATVLNVNPPCI